MKKNLIAFTVFTLLCVSCADTEKPYSYTSDWNTYDPYDTGTTYITPQPRLTIEDADYWNSLLTNDTTFDPYISTTKNEDRNLDLQLIRTLNIHTKLEKYEKAITEFYRTDDYDRGFYNPETLERAISTLSILETAIAQFKANGGDHFTFAELEEILYENKNYLLLRKFSVMEKIEQYYATEDDFLLYDNQEKAQEALKKNVELRNAISQFRESGGDQEVFSEMEEELAGMQVLLESYVYKEA